MSRTSSIALAIIAIVVLIAGGTYVYVTAPTKAPSAPIEQVAVETPSMNAPSSTEATPDTASQGYRIVSERSQAQFSLDEDLRGNHITVVGTTNQVSGTVQADRANLSTAMISPIKINARTFVTDSEQRNNAIRRIILKSEDDANEFITFTPKTVTGLPASAEIGQSFPLAVTGDLWISGTSKEVTFQGTASFTSDNELKGHVDTTVHYPDFGVSVPNLPFLANVDQDAKLALDFVAVK